MKKNMMIIISVILGLLVITGVFMKINGISPIGLKLHKPVFQKQGVALAGFDVTEYFNGQSREGSAQFSTSFQGMTWHFSSEANLNTFIANPQHFAPRFGGYCSKAVSTGFVAPADPLVFTVYENELFMFSSNEQKQKFSENPDLMISQCTNNWK